MKKPIIYPENSCKSCAWFMLYQECLAFSGKIPKKIWNGNNDHKKSVRGDHNIKYTPIKDVI